jgi:tRNA threonylcarbamoyladenosine biosynthesis protein TsaE
MHPFPSQEFFSTSPESTREIARQFATTLNKGDIVTLTGTLGAGKTEFTRGILDVFHSPSLVTSPTFTLLNIYHGSRKGEAYEMYHFDLYRLTSDSELAAIGFDEYVYGDGISIIEWAEKFPASIPKRAHRVEIFSVGETDRRIVID